MREEVLAELKRELEVRQRVYPRWVANGKLSQKTADDRIGAIAWAIGFIEGSGGLVEHERPEQLSLIGDIDGAMDTGGRW